MRPFNPIFFLRKTDVLNKRKTLIGYLNPKRMFTSSSGIFKLGIFRSFFLIFFACTSFVVGANAQLMISCPPDSTVTCAAEVPAIDITLIVYSGNCGPVTVTHLDDVITNQTCSNTFLLTRTYQAVDSCAQVAVCSQIISVLDTIAPVITCPVVVSPIPCGDTPVFGTPTVTDACDISVVVTFSDVTISGLCQLTNSITRTWIATDDCGNTASCSATIIVAGSDLLAITCMPDTLVGCIAEVPAIDISLVEVSGGCGNAIVIHLTDVISNQSCLNNYTLTRTYQATDACGQIETCTQIITVSDTTGPVIVFIQTLPQVSGDTIVTQCYGQDPQWDIPSFDIESIIALDRCAEGGVENVVITYDISLEAEGNCSADGYINLYRLVWTATDVCGNSSSVHLYLALVDTIAPVIEGIPDNITVNCENIPEPPVVFATDECLCACVVSFQESDRDLSACQNGQVIIRTWTAIDRCGNETIDTQRITLIDQDAPILYMTHPQLIDYADGSVVEYTCSEGGIPAFYSLLDSTAVYSAGVCDSSSVITFRQNSTLQINCDFYGYIEERQFEWIATDPCGNTSVMTLIVRLIDNEAPVIADLPEITCIGDPLLVDLEVTDDCDHVSVRFWDVNIPNPCGDGTATRRTYEAYDACGNMAAEQVILLPETQNEPLLVFLDPVMAQVDSGLIDLRLDCQATEEGRLTAFSSEDVRLEGVCAAGMTIEFTETLLSRIDCVPGGSMARVQLKWTASDACGGYTESIIIAEIVDESGPEFVNFKDIISIGCDELIPSVQVTDNCGDVVLTYADTIIHGLCAYEYDIVRLITATDQCGNTTIRRQTIQVGNENGPVITGVEQNVCDDLSIPTVSAYDACAGRQVTVTMQQDTLERECQDGMVIVRTWSATDACGTVTAIHQLIVINDHTPPEILIPSYSVIHQFVDHQNNTVKYSELSLLNKLNALDADEVSVADDCDLQILPVLIVDTLFATDCLAQGYSERRTYTWTAADICNNTDTLSFTVDIIDDVAPEFVEVDYDSLIICAPLPQATPMLMVDTLENVTIVYTETQTPGPVVGQILVTRTWVATDNCQNVTRYIQFIVWQQESTLECAIILPEIVVCNSHGILINSEVLGGLGLYNYEWDVVGEKCFIQSGQGTPEILIYMGWADVNINLTVTDSFGCVSVCSVSLDCDDINALMLPNSLEDTNLETTEGQAVFHAPVNSNSELNDDLNRLSFWPNPADEVIHIAFESEIEGFVNFLFTDYLGKVIQTESMMVYKGSNVQQIDASGLANGSYLIQIKSEKAHYTQGVIILHME